MERDDDMSAVKIVISHNVAEQKLAEAWQKLIQKISLNAIEVWYSSDTQSSGGMGVGKEWRADLYDRLEQCNFVLAIQTNTSAGKPWIMWECGVASGIGKDRGIIPIVYEMDRGSLPNPLNTYESYRGDDQEQVREVCEKLVKEAGLTPSKTLTTKAIGVYLSAVELHLSRKSAPIASVNTMLWSNRIDNLVQSGRIAELKNLRQQMYASQGTPPLDSVLHDVLGQLLLQQHAYQEALEETEYGLALTPGDIPLLHRKALALVGLHNLVRKNLS